MFNSKPRTKYIIIIALLLLVIAGMWFYQVMYGSTAEALQRAQQKLMQNVRYRHPGYWSPFLLIGNWL